MTETMTHAEFEALLPDALEQTLAAGDQPRFDAHRAACADCAGVYADLVQLRQQAAALPALSPSRDLWAGIEARIQAPVIPITPVPGTVAAVRRTSGGAARADADAVAERGADGRGGRGVRPGMRWLSPGVAAAAVLLVAVTAGVTWTAARRDVPADATVAGVTVGDAAARAPGAGAAVPVADAVRETERMYDTEIASLRTLLEQRRAELDERTIAVLEKNLQVIDAAIAESRAALAADPGNAFLTERLTGTLDAKLQLLRGAATLPART